MTLVVIKRTHVFFDKLKPNCQNMQQIKAITLDVGYTLLFPQPSLGQIYSEAAERCGFEITSDAAEEKFFAAWKAEQREHNGLIYGRTHAEAQAFWLNVIKRVFCCDGNRQEQVGKLQLDLYECFGSAKYWRVNEDLDVLLESCSQKGIQVALLSNWDLRLRSLLNELGLLEKIDTIIISAEHGLEKPDRRIFDYVLSELRLQPHEAIHVGDTWTDDVVAAATVGCGAAWFNPKGLPVPDAGIEFVEIRHLRELVDIWGR